MSDNQSIESGQTITPNFTKEDFCMNDRAFQWLYGFQTKPDQFMKMDIWLENYAATKLKIGKIHYKSLKNSFLQKLNQDEDRQLNVTVFPEQPIKLICGKYTADRSGVAYINDKGITIEVISHPIMPIKKYINTETIKLT